MGVLIRMKLDIPESRNGRNARGVGKPHRSSDSTQQIGAADRAAHLRGRSCCIEHRTARPLELRLWAASRQAAQLQKKDGTPLRRLSRETSMSAATRTLVRPFCTRSLRAAHLCLFIRFFGRAGRQRPGGAFGTGLGGEPSARGAPPALGGALGAGVSSAPHLTHFAAVTGFKAPHMGHLTSFLPTVGGLKHIFFLLLTGC